MTYTAHQHERISHMAAPIPAAVRSLLASLAVTPVSEATPATTQDDEAAWDAWQQSTFGRFGTSTPAATAQQPDPSTAAFDDFERATFPGLNR